MCMQMFIKNTVNWNTVFTINWSNIVINTYKTNLHNSLMGHSMSGDPAKWGFFILPSPKLTKFYKGKDLRLLSSTKLEFLKSDLYFQNYEHLKFWCFSRGLDQNILGVLLLELQLIVTPLSLNIFIQYFAIKWKASCWIKQHKVFHWRPLNPD